MTSYIIENARNILAGQSLPEAADTPTKTRLVTRVKARLERRLLKQTDAAGILSTPQSKVLSLVNYRLDDLPVASAETARQFTIGLRSHRKM